MILSIIIIEKLLYFHYQLRYDGVKSPQKFAVTIESAKSIELLDIIFSFTTATIILIVINSFGREPVVSHVVVVHVLVHHGGAEPVPVVVLRGHVVHGVHINPRDPWLETTKFPPFEESHSNE